MRKGGREGGERKKEGGRKADRRGREGRQRRALEHVRWLVRP